MIRMKHEKHGFHIAYNNNEVAYLENLGWTKEAEEEKEEKPVKRGKLTKKYDALDK